MLDSHRKYPVSRPPNDLPNPARLSMFLRRQGSLRRAQPPYLILNPGTKKSLSLFCVHRTNPALGLSLVILKRRLIVAFQATELMKISFERVGSSSLLGKWNVPIRLPLSFSTLFHVGLLYKKSFVSNFSKCKENPARRDLFLSGTFTFDERKQVSH